MKKKLLALLKQLRNQQAVYFREAERCRKINQYYDMNRYTGLCNAFRWAAEDLEKILNEN